jgi:uncharacterized protein
MLYFAFPAGRGVCVKIDLSHIEQEPMSLDEVLTLAPERLDGEQVAAPITVRLAGEVRPSGESFMVSGKWVADGPLKCSRCLSPVPWKVDESFFVEYRLQPAMAFEGEIGLAEGDLEVAFLEGSELDLEELAAEQVLLALPMRIVCAEDCAGLCPRCGADRNDGACSCQPEVDPRWSALADLSGGTLKS